MSNRWWIYQKERFPVFGHGPLIVAFSASAVCFSALLRGATSPPPWPAFLVAFVTSFLFFFQLRVADEHKDFEEDSAYRPYRPVPRGLVTLKELAVLGIVGAVIQAALALWLGAGLLPWLIVCWVYFALMSREFFVRDWLKAHPFTYLWSHMLIMPLVDFYATACDWRRLGGEAPAGLGWFVAASFFNGIVIEVGRKLRAPADEETGVATYTVTWGRPKAVALWLTALALTLGSAVMAATKIQFALPLGLFLGAVWIGAAVVAWMFLRATPPAAGAGKRFELLSGLWTLALYLGLGVVPALIHFLSR
jgi:4-hydroxybenzoate polyprenyltransferase